MRLGIALNLGVMYWELMTAPRKAIATANVALSKLEDKHSELLRHFRQVSADLEESGKKNTRLSSLVREQTRSSEELSRRIAELEEKDAISTARIAELERSLASSNDSLALLQADVEKHKLRSKNLLHELEKEKSLRASAGERGTEMTALIDSLQLKNGEQEEEIKNLQKQAQSLRSRSESADGKFMDMREHTQDM